MRVIPWFVVVLAASCMGCDPHTAIDLDNTSGHPVDARIVRTGRTPTSWVTVLPGEVAAITAEYDPPAFEVEILVGSASERIPIREEDRQGNKYIVTYRDKASRKGAR